MWGMRVDVEIGVEDYGSDHCFSSLEIVKFKSMYHFEGR